MNDQPSTHAPHAHHEHTHLDHQHAPVAVATATQPVRTVTVRAVAGLSGDMMLSGLAALAELSDPELDAFVRELGFPALEGSVKIEPRSVHHIAGVGCRIDLPHEHAHRSFADIRKIIRASALPLEAKSLSEQAFALLAEAEAAVHDTAPENVTFHEVGALDSILDICLVCRIFTHLNADRLVCSPLPLADGAIRCAHGVVPSPAPAVLQLLEGVPVRAFAGQGETVTPTAIALLKALNADFGGWPEMTVSRTVTSYGTTVFDNAPNGAIWAIGDQ